VITRIVIVCC